MEIIRNKRKKSIVILLIIMLLMAVCRPVFANIENEQSNIIQRFSVKEITNKMSGLLEKIKTILRNIISKIKLMLNKFKEQIQKPQEELEESQRIIEINYFGPECVVMYDYYIHENGEIYKQESSKTHEEFYICTVSRDKVEQLKEYINTLESGGAVKYVIKLLSNDEWLKCDRENVSEILGININCMTSR